MKQNIWTLVWNGFKVLSAVLVVIWTLIQIGSHILPDESSLTAIGECLPVRVTEAFDSRLANVYFRVREARDNSDKASDECKQRCGEVLNPLREIDTGFLEQVSDLVLTSGVCLFEIDNTGSEQVDELYLDLQISGFARVDRATGPSKVDRFSNVLALGSIRPSDSIKATVWTQRGSPYQSGGRAFAKLTHPRGFVNVKAPYKLLGFRGWIGENLGFVSVCLFMLAFWVGVLLCNLSESQKKAS